MFRISKSMMWLMLIFISINTIAQPDFRYGNGAVFNEEEYSKVPRKPEGAMGWTLNVPSSASLKMYCPTPGDQGATSTCVGWGNAQALTVLYAKENGITDKWSIDYYRFSPFFIYNQIREETSCDAGTYVGDGVDLVFSKGGVMEKDYYLDCYTYVGSDMISSAGSNKYSYYFSLFEYREDEYSKKIPYVKGAISDGHPVVFGMYTDFYPKDPTLAAAYEPSFWYAGDVWSPYSYERDPAQRTGEGGGHCMTVIGYDDNKYGGAFEVLNSWGTEYWGNGGYTWITYDDFVRFVYEGYEVMKQPGRPEVPSPLSGCLRGNCWNGNGLYKDELDGWMYEGDWLDYYPHGTGTLTFNDGSVYVGQLQYGLRQGKGKMTFSDGSVLDGNWDGDYYVSASSSGGKPTDVCAKGDCTDGNGTFKWANGEYYEGGFSNGTMNGFGTYYYADGSKYMGLWENGKQNGFGVWLSDNFVMNNDIKMGEWLDGAMQGDDVKGFAAADKSTKKTNYKKVIPTPTALPDIDGVTLTTTIEILNSNDGIISSMLENNMFTVHRKDLGTSLQAKLRICSEMSTYLYVVRFDSKLKASQVFPDKNKTANLGYSQESFEIPQGDGYLSAAATGDEYWVLIYSKDKLEISSNIKSLNKAKGTVSEKIASVYGSMMDNANVNWASNEGIGFQATSPNAKVVPVIILVK